MSQVVVLMALWLRPAPLSFSTPGNFSLSCYPGAVPRCDAVACGPKGVYQGTVFPLWWKMQGATICFLLGKEQDGTLWYSIPPDYNYVSSLWILVRFILPSLGWASNQGLESMNCFFLILPAQHDVIGVTEQCDVEMSRWSRSLRTILWQKAGGLT